MLIIYGLFAFIIPVLILVGLIYFVVKFVSKDSNNPNMLTPKELGMEIGIFISLFTSLISVATVVFAAIDKKFPDILSNTYYGDYGYEGIMSDDIRISISVALISFPIYIGLVWLRSKYFEKHRDRAAIPAMKYQNYVSIFFATLFIVGTLVSVVYNYIGGEISSANGLKALVVIIMAASLFTYYYKSLKRNYSEGYKPSIVLALVSLVLVFGVIFYSIAILGSPAQIRKMRIDDKRLSDLNTIQQQILSHWQQKKSLPTDTGVLASDGLGSGITVPKDPVTKDPYKYNIIQDSKIIKGKGEDCARRYPGKYVTYSNNGEAISMDTSKITCDLPTEAVFEICASFDTVRMYDENGVDQRSNPVFTSEFKYIPLSVDSVYYGGSYDKTPNWNHQTGEQCFKRTIDPTKYGNY